MKKKSKIHYIYIIIIVIMVICIIFVGKNLINKSKLDREVNTLFSKNVMTDNYDTKTKTSGSYKKIEHAIKKYMKDYSENIKSVSSIINGNEMKNILSASNYESDKPEFNKSLSILSENKTKFNNLIKKLVSMSSEKEIMSYIEKEHVSDKYRKIYKGYMINNSNDLKMIRDNIKKVENTGINLFNTNESVINLLKNNPNGWVIKDNKIYFYSNSVMSDYNNLINNIKKNKDVK